MTMLMPNDDGYFVCSECNFKHQNIFKFIEHCMLDYRFFVKVSRNWSIDIYALLDGIDKAIGEDDSRKAQHLIEMTILTLINSLEGKAKFDKFLNEMFIEDTSKSLINELEDMLKNETK